MKKLYLICVLIAAMFCGGTTALCLSGADDDEQQVQIAAIDTYDITMRLQIPRIYDNTESLGYRRYQSQLIKGEMLLHYTADGTLADVTFTNMVNRTHRLSNGKYVTYGNTELDTMIWPRFNAIGSNKTGKFKTASLCFYVAAEPSYNIGEFDEDNALYIMLAGKGVFHTSKKYLRYASGYVTGTLGCGCMAYGHVSPTRKITFYGPGDEVDDVASVFGRWSIQFKAQKNCKR